MNVTLRIPDELAARLTAAGSDLERRALEAFGLTEYPAGRLTDFELRQLQGFDTRYELDGFLKERGISLDYTMADLAGNPGPARLLSACGASSLIPGRCSTWC